MATEHPDYISADTPMSEDSLVRAKKLASRYAELVGRIEEADGKLKDMRRMKVEMERRTIPDLFAELQIDHVGLSDSNVDVVVSPYYHANIASDWEPEMVARGFGVLEDMGGGDLIRATVSVSFTKSEYDDAQELLAFIQEKWGGANQHPPSLEMKVPWNSLTSFVREYVQDDDEDDITGEQMAALGATVGTIAKLKKRKK